jgi:hypothetical protein
MKTTIRCNSSQILGLITILAILVSAGRSPGAFVGPYALTPPVVGSYTNSPSGSTFGGWTATTTVGVPLDTYQNVNTSGALLTDTLHLEVGDTAAGFQVGSDMTFTTVIVAAGILSFDYTAGYGGGGPNNLEFLLNGSVVATHPVSGSFSTAVVASDIFGFRLSSTYAAYSSEVMVNVSNFNVPEPGSAVLLFSAGLLLFRRRRHEQPLFFRPPVFT